MLMENTRYICTCGKRTLHIYYQCLYYVNRKRTLHIYYQWLCYVNTKRSPFIFVKIARSTFNTNVYVLLIESARSICTVENHAPHLLPMSILC